MNPLRDLQLHKYMQYFLRKKLAKTLQQHAIDL